MPTKRDIILEQINHIEKDQIINITTKNMNYYEGQFEKYNSSLGVLVMKIKEQFKYISFDDIQTVF